MKNENPQTLGAIVDRLGALKALAANLADESEILKGELILAGVPAIDGGVLAVDFGQTLVRDDGAVVRWVPAANLTKLSNDGVIYDI